MMLTLQLHVTTNHSNARHPLLLNAEKERESERKKAINKQSKKNSVPPTITLTSDMQSV